MSEGTEVAQHRRLGRAVAFVHLADNGGIPPTTAAEIEPLLVAGRAMDFIARLKDFKAAQLTSDVVENFAKMAGIGRPSLMNPILPALKRADVINYTVSGSEIVGVEEFVGITGTLVELSFRVLTELNPTAAELALLHSVELASWAPLTESNHLHQLVRRGFEDEVAQHGYHLALSVGVNNRIPSPDLGEDVVFNPYVWGTRQISIAKFLRSLPSAERDVMLGLCEQASDRPGLALPSLQTSQHALVSARKVGLIQATTVKSSAAGGSSQIYVFSPLLETEDDRALTTEALHQRKMFVAHILFGVEKARSGGGRIKDPTLLVRRLYERGVVGSATNIGTDYHLLEAQGIVSVEPDGGDRAFLQMVKREIVRDGLDWLERTVGNGSGGATPTELLLPPSQFVTPEQDRARLSDQGATDEVGNSVVLRLRKELQSATRQDSVF
ncbi:MAG: hypothetical protein OXG67_09680 [bacterium]|nr:hypothetical protein [bacterium]MCY3889185.1 hypothetical protein [bacterium]